MTQMIDPTDGEIRIMEHVAAGRMVNRRTNVTQARIEALEARGLFVDEGGGKLTIKGAAFLARRNETLIEGKLYGKEPRNDRS